MKLIALFVLTTALALSQGRPLDNIASRQYQHEIRPLRLALDRWLHELGLQDAGLSIRLVKATDLPGQRKYPMEDRTHQIKAEEFAAKEQHAGSESRCGRIQDRRCDDTRA